MVTFTRVNKHNGWLNCMSAHAVVHNLLEYQTVEHLFHVLRFPEFSDIRNQIRQQDTPMKAKVLAKIHANQMVIKQRGPEDLDNMRMCLMLKTQQHPELAQLLLATGDEIIVEDVTKRMVNVSGESEMSALFWGMKRNANESWVGENWLGKLWMEVRSELRHAIS